MLSYIQLPLYAGYVEAKNEDYTAYSKLPK